MSDLYRDMTPPNEFSPRGAWVHDLVEMKLLVPVERCVHGRVDPHSIASRDVRHWNWCIGGEADDE